MPLFNSILDLIGNTPMVRLNRVVEEVVHLARQVGRGIEGGHSGGNRIDGRGRDEVAG